MKILFICLSLALTSCAQLYHVQIGEVVSHPGYIPVPFTVMVSETGVNIEQATQATGLLMSKSDNQALKKISSIVQMFQMGPRTGNPVFSKNYADNMIDLIYSKCPSGKITGLVSIREANQYPIVSGEIVKVTGICMEKKGS